MSKKDGVFVIKFTKADLAERMLDFVEGPGFEPISSPESFQYCCGAYEIGGFPEDSILEDAASYIEEELDYAADYDSDVYFNGSELERRITTDELEPLFIAELADMISGDLPKGVPVIATTLVKRQSLAGQALAKAGFVEQFRWTNPGTKNRLIFWLRKPPRS